MMKTVSIIVPVYNLAAKIGDCLNSLIGQSYSALEIIIVDDGSTDESASICKTIASRDSRVIFLQKRNGGVSSARNMGLDHASGEFLMFVDGDDTVVPNYVETYVSNAEVTGADMVLGGFTKKTDSGAVVFLPQAGLFNRREIFSVICRKGTQSFGYVCSKLFLRKLIKNTSLRFCEEMHSQEDLDFFISACSHAHKICCIEDCGYQYNYSPSERGLPIKDLLGNQIKLYLVSNGVGADTSGLIPRFQHMLYTLFYHADSVREIEEIADIEVPRELLAHSRQVRMEIQLLLYAFRGRKFRLILMYFRMRKAAKKLRERL